MSTIPPFQDPTPPDWRQLTLPDTWPDQIDFGSMKDFSKFILSLFGKRKRVQLPESMPGAEKIPKYALQEFHSLPNGNYSNTITKGYIKGFDAMMLGTMDTARGHLAGFMEGCESVLDVGCGGGKTAAAVKAQGVKDVWGLDISPYLLKTAAIDFPSVHFIQARAEATEFQEQRFDGITSCFLFHEIPPKYAGQSLREFHRILKPGGKVAIAEPSPIQLEENNLFKLVKIGGATALYFKLLAHFVHEPFVRAWHKLDIESFFDDHGFQLVKDEIGFPIREIYAIKK